MDAVTVVLLVLAALTMTMCLVFLVRNERVFKFRMKLNHNIYEKAVSDRKSGRRDPKRDYWDGYDTVSYDEMFWKFWRRLDSFHDPEYLKEMGMIDDVSR